MNNTTSNGTVYEVVYPSDAGYIIFGLVETLCFLIGAPGSAIIMSYFIVKTKDGSASEFLNVCISFTDLVICLLTLSSAVSDFSYGDPVVFSNGTYCGIWGFLWNVSSKMSIFTIAVLSIARTLCVVVPFLGLRRRHIAIPVLIYFLIMVFQSSTPFIFTAKGAQGGYFYEKSYTLCGFYIGEVFDIGTVEFQVFQYWVSYVNLLLPLPVIAISCCITVYSLKCAGSVLIRRESRRNSEGGKFKHEATITVLILTFIYLAFNTPICLFWILLLHTTVLHSVLPANEFTVDKVIFFNSIGLRSLCNVVAYFCRIRGLREYTRDMLRVVITKLGCAFRLLVLNRLPAVETPETVDIEMTMSRGVTKEDLWFDLSASSEDDIDNL